LASLSAGGGVDASTIASVIEAGGVGIDTREPNAFAIRHIPGTISIGADGGFVNWVGWLAPYDSPVYIIVESEEQYGDLVMDLYRIGVDDVGGYLAGGVDAWAASGKATDSYDVI